MISGPAAPSPEQYTTALRRLPRVTDLHLRMLRLHYSAPDRTITADQLAHALGYEHHATANSQYGRLGRLVGEMLDYNPMRERLGTLVIFEKRDGEWHWLLRPQVATALELLGWVRGVRADFMLLPDEVSASEAGRAEPDAAVAENLRRELEVLGEYVVRANAGTGWFAMFPKKLAALLDLAETSGRDGPNLIVYATNRSDRRSHYVVPYKVMRPLLAEKTLTTSSVDGTRRWNLTLKGGRIRVSHRDGSVDVSIYRGLRLLAEPGDDGGPSGRAFTQRDVASAGFLLDTTPAGSTPLERSVRRMAATARSTAAASESVGLRTLKNKQLGLACGELEDHIRALIKHQRGRCALTGLDLAYDDAEDRDLLCSLDRIDSNGHYEAGNLQVVCQFANRWKSDDTDSNFRRLLRLVRTVDE